MIFNKFYILDGRTTEVHEIIFNLNIYVVSSGIVIYKLIFGLGSLTSIDHVNRQISLDNFFLQKKGHLS